MKKTICILLASISIIMLFQACSKGTNNNVLSSESQTSKTLNSELVGMANVEIPQNQITSSNTAEIENPLRDDISANITVNKSYILEDFSSIDEENVVDYGEKLILDGVVNQKYLEYNATEAIPTSLIMVDITIKNTSSSDQEYGVSGLQIIPAYAVENVSYSNLVYLTPHQNAKDTDKMFMYQIKAGESIDITLGYTVATKSLSSALYYKMNIFNHTGEKETKKIPYVELSI